MCSARGLLFRARAKDGRSSRLPIPLISLSTISLSWSSRFPLVIPSWAARTPCCLHRPRAGRSSRRWVPKPPTWASRSHWCWTLPNGSWRRLSSNCTQGSYLTSNISSCFSSWRNCTSFRGWNSSCAVPPRHPQLVTSPSLPSWIHAGCHVALPLEPCHANPHRMHPLTPEAKGHVLVTLSVDHDLWVHWALRMLMDLHHICRDLSHVDLHHKTLEGWETQEVLLVTPEDLRPMVSLEDLLTEIPEDLFKIKAQEYLHRDNS